MSRLDPATLEQARAKTRDIMERAQADAGFRRQVRDDPAGTLRQVGMPEAAIAPFIEEAGLGDSEVAGYMDNGLGVINSCIGRYCDDPTIG